MREHGHEDITERIDALTNDAASWSADGDRTAPWWATAAPGSMVALELDVTGARPVEISEATPATDIARHVGDSFCPLMTALRKVQFLVGAPGTGSAPVNTGATELLHKLLAAVRDGRYIASDAEREYARAVLASNATAPVIHGPCLITGVGQDGAPAPLDDNFQCWFSAVLDEIAQRRAERAAAIAAALGIALEDLGDSVVLVRLG